MINGTLSKFDVIDTNGNLYIISSLMNQSVFNQSGKLIKSITARKRFDEYSLIKNSYCVVSFLSY